MEFFTQAWVYLCALNVMRVQKRAVGKFFFSDNYPNVCPAPVSSIQAALLYSSKKYPYPFHCGQQKFWAEGWRFQKEVIFKGLGVASEGFFFPGVLSKIA